MIPTMSFKIRYVIILLLCDSQIKSFLSVGAAPGHVFMSQGDTSFQFTIPDHTEGGQKDKGLTLSEKVRMMILKESEDKWIPPVPSRKLKAPKKCSSAEQVSNSTTCTSSKSAIRTRQAQEFSPRLLPRPISPVGPDMVVPIPRLIFPRHVSSSAEFPAFHPDHPLSNFVNTPKKSQFRFPDENRSPKFLEHEKEFHPVKSVEIFDHTRRQSSHAPSISFGQIKQSFNRPPSSNSNQDNHTNFSSERHWATYAEYNKANNARFNRKPSSSESFFGRPPIPTGTIQIPNFKQHFSHENIPTNFKWQKQENDRPGPDTNPNFNVFFQRLRKWEHQGSDPSRPSSEHQGQIPSGFPKGDHQGPHSFRFPITEHQGPDHSRPSSERQGLRFSRFPKDEQQDPDPSKFPNREHQGLDQSSFPKGEHQGPNVSRSSSDHHDHQNSKETERPRFINSNEILHQNPNQNKSENRLQTAIPESNAANNHSNYSHSIPKIGEQDSSSSTASSKNVSDGSQELELYQKLLGYLLTKLSNRNSTHKNIFSDIIPK